MDVVDDTTTTTTTKTKTSSKEATQLDTLKGSKVRVTHICLSSQEPSKKERKSHTSLSINSSPKIEGLPCCCIETIRDWSSWHDRREEITSQLESIYVVSKSQVSTELFAASLIYLNSDCRSLSSLKIGNKNMVHAINED